MMSPLKDNTTERFERQLAEIHEVPPSLDSPVNLNIREATILTLPKLSWQNYEKPPKKMKITNTGQTVVLSGKWFSERPHLKGGALSSRYVFSQIHFHWGGEPERGSEHTVDGFRMPLEMHLVHFKAEYGSQDNALLQDDGLFVIGCFFKLQPDDNPAMSALTDKLAFIARPHTSYNVALCPIASLVAEFDGDYFSYWGSMCSDNCQHTILWCFPRTLVGISRQQVMQFQHLVNGAGWPLRVDEQIVKPLGNRQLFLVNPSDLEPSTTLPGIDELRNSQTSVESLASRTSTESWKPMLADEMLNLKTYRTASSLGSTLTSRSAEQATGLAEESVKVSPTTSMKSARLTGNLASTKPAKESIKVSPTTSMKSARLTGNLASMKPAKESIKVSPTTSMKSARLTGNLASTKPAKESIKVSPTTSMKSARLTGNLASTKPADKSMKVSPTTSMKSARLTGNLASTKPAEESATISPTTSTKSAGKPSPTESTADDPAANAADSDTTDTRGTVLTHPESGQEEKTIFCSSAGSARSNDSLCKLGDVLASPSPQNITLENVKKEPVEKPMPRKGSSEELLRAIENMRRAQTRLKDGENDLDNPSRCKVATSENHSRENVSAKLPPREIHSRDNPSEIPPQQPCEQEVKCFKLQAPSIANKTNAALKTRYAVAITPEARQTSKFKKRHVSPSISKRSKDAPKQRSDPGTVAPGRTANYIISAELGKSCKAKISPTIDSNVSDVSENTVKGKESIHSQASYYSSISVIQDPLQLPLTDNSPEKRSRDDDGALNDRGTFLPDEPFVATPEKYDTEQSWPYAHKHDLQKPHNAPQIELTAKVSPASFTVSLAGCWKKPDVTKDPVTKKEVPNATKDEETPGVNCRVSPSVMRSVLEKLEREVSATLRQGQADDTDLSPPSGGHDGKYRTLVQLDGSLPSILGDQDSYASLANLDEDETDNNIVSLFRRDMCFERNQLNHGKTSWRKKPSYHNSKNIQSDVDEQPMGRKERPATRTNSLLLEATELLRKHRQAVAEAYNMQITL